MSIRIGPHRIEAFIASGGMNFWGQGWWWHLLLFFIRPFGFNAKGACVIGKTTTLDPRKDNMPLTDNYQPREFFPRCIIIKRGEDSVLNAVGLSGPGAAELFRHPGWKKVKLPFVYSFMATGGDSKERLEEARNFVTVMKNRAPIRGNGVALEVNVSCPNTGHNTCEFMGEVLYILRAVNDLKKAGIVSAIFLKVNVLMPIEIILDVQKSGLCDAVDCSNTIPWGALYERIPWVEIFGSTESPLAEFGGGGLSGKYLLPIVAEWIRTARDKGVFMPIIAGGGILKPEDVLVMKQAGANAISIGSVLMLRPWNVEPIIEEAKKVF